MKHLIITDQQVRPNVDTRQLGWIGKLIVDERPDVIVCIGDFADMHSLNSYDKAAKKIAFEGRRYKDDIQSSKDGMAELLKQLHTLNEYKSIHKKRLYKPRMVMCLGNHEERILRVAQMQPELEGMVSIEDLEYKRWGWEVYNFLEVVKIDGVQYSHYFINDHSPAPIGRAHLLMAKRHASCTAGHMQVLDYSVSQHTANGRRLQCLIAGAGYLHDEAYRSAQGNDHWRGVVIKTNVEEGEYDPQFISLESLEKRYG